MKKEFRRIYYETVACDGSEIFSNFGIAYITLGKRNKIIECMYPHDFTLKVFDTEGGLGNLYKEISVAFEKPILDAVNGFKEYNPQDPNRLVRIPVL